MLPLTLSAHAPPPSSQARRNAARLLDLPVRRDILRLVTTRPGRPLGELLDELQVGWGTLHHHLKRLEQAGLVHSVCSGRRRLVFPGPSAPTPALERAQALLAGRTARRVAEAVEGRPGVSIETVVALVGESQRAVYYHVKRLVEAGLLLSARPARYDELRPAPGLGALLARQKPLPTPPGNGG